MADCSPTSCAGCFSPWSSSRRSRRSPTGSTAACARSCTRGTASSEAWRQTSGASSFTSTSASRAATPAAPRSRRCGRAAGRRISICSWGASSWASSAAAAWCAARPRTLSARVVEGLGSVVYSMPVYVVAFGLLLLFEPTFGVLPLPLFFHPIDYETPLANPWDFVRSMAVPWLVVAAPLGAICLRLALVSIHEVADTDHVRTAVAKGLSRRRVIRHHAAPSAYVSVASLVAAWVPTFVTNMVLVEFVLFVPGFFVNTRRALSTEDIPMLQALTVWAAVIIVVISTLADLALVLIDPRIRSSGRLPG